MQDNNWELVSIFERAVKLRTPPNVIGIKQKESKSLTKREFAPFYQVLSQFSFVVFSPPFFCCDL